MDFVHQLRWQQNASVVCPPSSEEQRMEYGLFSPYAHS